MGKYNPVPRKISDPHRARSVWHPFRCVRSYAGNAQLTFRGGLRFQVALHRILVRLSRILLCFKANGMGINSGKFEDDRKKQRHRKSSLVAKKLEIF